MIAAFAASGFFNLEINITVLHDGHVWSIQGFVNMALLELLSWSAKKSFTLNALIVKIMIAIVKIMIATVKVDEIIFQYPTSHLDSGGRSREDLLQHEHQQ